MNITASTLYPGTQKLIVGQSILDAPDSWMKETRKNPSFYHKKDHKTWWVGDKFITKAEYDENPAPASRSTDSQNRQTAKIQATKAIDRLNVTIEKDRKTRLEMIQNEGSGTRKWSLHDGEQPNVLKIQALSESTSQVKDQGALISDDLAGILVNAIQYGKKPDEGEPAEWINKLATWATPMTVDTVDGTVYMPAPEYTTTYNFGWEQDENKIQGKIQELAMYSAGVDAIKKGDITQAAGNLVTAMIKDNNDLITQTAFANKRVAFNDRQKQYFQSVDMRNFDFSWHFIPSDRKEYNDIKDCINWLKNAAHPQLSPAFKFMRYPMEFGLVFMHRTPDRDGNVNGEYGSLKRNVEVPQIGRCACTSIDVNYTPNRFVTHRTGEMNEIQLSISFVEIDKLFRSEFHTANEGY